MLRTLRRLGFSDTSYLTILLNNNNNNNNDNDNDNDNDNENNNNFIYLT